MVYWQFWNVFMYTRTRIFFWAHCRLGWKIYWPEYDDPSLYTWVHFPGRRWLTKIPAENELSSSLVSSCPVSLNWFYSHHRDDSQRELAVDTQWCKGHSSSVVGSCIRTRLKKMNWCGSEGLLHSRKLPLHSVLIPSLLLFCLPSKLVTRCPIIYLLIPHLFY